MTLQCRVPFVTALLLTAAACSASTAPRDARTTVVVQRDTVVAQLIPNGDVTWLRFELPIVVENAGPAAVVFVQCASSVEEQRSDGWHLIWSPICALDSRTLVEVGPGASRELNLTVMAAANGPGAPVWGSRGVDGTYRFAAGVHVAGASGVIPKTASNTFALTVESQAP